MTGERLNRRQILKATGAASAALGSAGLGFFGYEAGRDPDSHTGCEQALVGVAQGEFRYPEGFLFTHNQIDFF